MVAQLLDFIKTCGVQHIKGFESLTPAAVLNLTYNARAVMSRFLRVRLRMLLSLRRHVTLGRADRLLPRASLLLSTTK